MMLFYLFCIVILIQLGYILIGYSKVLFFKAPSSITPSTEGISVIIAAKDEYSRLKVLIPTLLQQSYPNFEIIVILDRCQDDSEKYLKGINDQRLHIIKQDIVEKGCSPKKSALTKGIQAARHERLLFTDADCLPMSKDWIQQMVQPYQVGMKNEIVLGVSLYQTGSGLLQKFIQFETLHTATQYLSMALWGIPFMGVGRNLSYRKSTFLKHGGFGNQMNILSGDDDLMINKMAHSSNTSICIHQAGQTYSFPETTWRSWYRQKKRHLSVGKFYSLRNKILLGFNSTSQISVYFLYLILLALDIQVVAASLLFWSRIGGLTLVLYQSARRLHSPLSWWLVPLMDLLHVIYQLVIGMVATLSKQKTWN
ncbi:glycosyltransferase [Algivirga pacifica]|uniref:Glycosyltransferase n=1 Tax=Algivirga pacifica TaxID=1162670 RepID=A0ABP9DL09_9BACT